MRRRSSIVIRADDHFGEPLGVIFLLEPEQLGETVIEKLREYLGAQTEIIKAVVSRDQIEVEVECATFTEEAERMVEAARGLQRNRLYRSAEAALRESLKLDPFNLHALMALAEVLQDSERFDEAIAALIRAREAALRKRLFRRVRHALDVMPLRFRLVANDLLLDALHGHARAAGSSQRWLERHIAAEAETRHDEEGNHSGDRLVRRPT